MAPSGAIRFGLDLVYRPGGTRWVRALLGAHGDGPGDQAEPGMGVDRREQAEGAARVLGCDVVHGLERLNGAQRDVLQITKRCGDQVKHAAG